MYGRRICELLPVLVVNGQCWQLKSRGMYKLCEEKSYDSESGA